MACTRCQTGMRYQTGVTLKDWTGGAERLGSEHCFCQICLVFVLGVVILVVSWGIFVKNMANREYAIVI